MLNIDYRYDASVLRQKARSEVCGRPSVQKMVITSIVYFVALAIFTIQAATFVTVDSRSVDKSYLPNFLDRQRIVSSLIACIGGFCWRQVETIVKNQITILREERLAQETQCPIDERNCSDMNGIIWAKFREMQPMKMQLLEEKDYGEITDLFLMDPDCAIQIEGKDRKLWFKEKISNLEQAITGVNPEHSRFLQIIPGIQAVFDKESVICKDIIQLLKGCSGLLQQIDKKTEVSQEQQIQFKRNFFTGLKEAMLDCSPTVYRFLVQEIPKLQKIIQGQLIDDDAEIQLREAIAELVLAYKEQIAQECSPESNAVSNWHAISYYSQRLGEYLGMPKVDDPFIIDEWMWEDRDIALNRFKINCQAQGLVDFVYQRMLTQEFCYKSLDGSHFCLIYLQNKGVATDGLYDEISSVPTRLAIAHVLVQLGIIDAQMVSQENLLPQ